MNRLSRIFIIVTALMFWTISVNAQDDLQPGDPVIFTAGLTYVYAYPDADSDITAIMPQGYIDRIGPAAAQEDDWVFLVDRVGYIQRDESGLALRTDELQQQLLEAVSAEIDQDPDEHEPLVRRGTIFRYMRDYDAALADYTAAITLAPDEPMVYFFRGDVYKDMRQYENASSDYKQAVELGANDARTLTGFGLIYERLHQYADAASWYEQVIQQYPGAFFAYNNLGVVEELQNNHDRAIEYYNQATDLNIYGAAPYHNRALIYENRRDIDAAVAELNAYIELGPYDPSIYVSLANLYAFKLDDPYTALDYVDDALNLDPKFSDAYVERAVIYAYEIVDDRQALADFQLAIEYDPYNIIALDRAGIYYARRGDFKTALKFYDDQAAISEVPSRYYIYRAQMYYGLEDYDHARATINIYLDNGIIDNIIDYTTAHLILGMIALQEEDYVSATEHYTAAFLITQEWTRNWTESRGLRVIDSRAALVQVYYEGIITNPEEPENYLQLANILMEFGVWDEALGYYRQYLTMVDNPDLQALVDTIQFYLE